MHAKVPLLGHHTSGVRKEWYRTEEDLFKHSLDDPGPKLRKALLQQKGITEEYLDQIAAEELAYVQKEFDKKYNMVWMSAIGFNNAYALMMRRNQAAQFNIKTISDLKYHTDNE